MPHQSSTGPATAAPLLDERDIPRLLRPVIVGGTFLAYSYVREFHRAYGIERCIVVLSQDVKMISTSRFVDARIVEGAGTPEVLYGTLEAIAAELKAEEPDCVPLVLGCDDRHALMFAEGRARLEAAGFVVPCNDPAMLGAISQKHVFYDLCEKLDIPYPKTWYFSCGGEGPDTLPTDELPYPCIAKPSNTTAFQNATVEGKRKAYEVETPEELAEIWRALRASDYDDEIVIQDFIPGDDSALRIANTFTDASFNLRVVGGGIVALQDHNPAALGNPLVIIGEREQRVIECAQRFLAEVGFHGYANFDIKYDKRTDEYVFFEINIRAGRSTYYLSLGGINFVTPIVDEFILHREIPYTEAYRPFIYSCVPTYVIKRSVTDQEQRASALRLLKTTTDPYPLHYGPDCLAHNFWAWVMAVNQIVKFKKYYWSTDGKQYK